MLSFACVGAQKETILQLHAAGIWYIKVLSLSDDQVVFLKEIHTHEETLSEFTDQYDGGKNFFKT